MVITIVTGIWNIKRDTLSQGWSRNFDHYLNNLVKLMETKDNMIIYIEEQYKEFVQQHRKQTNTLIIVRELDWFKENETFFNSIQNIRKSPEWYNQSGWLSSSTQAQLEMYNPIVMSKMFLLNDAVILDKFKSTHFVWVDGGLTNTVNEGYFTKDNVIEKFGKYLDKFSFVCFPYDGKVEIHGFEYNSIVKYTNCEVDMVARGGIFGGPKDLIPHINSIYYSLLMDTLNKNLMGTEESLFTIMCYNNPKLIQYFDIENDGLLGTFFENLKNDKLIPKICESKSEGHSVYTTQKLINDYKVGLYVITFNSPNQFETLIKSMLEYDRNFIDKPKKYLLDNSVDLSTTPRYIELCEEYGFEHIKKDNIGICGGRQFVSDHFNESDLDVMFWSEDDMFFQYKPGETCRNGFNRYVPDLYYKSLEILFKEGFDFLKLNFSEFFGDSSTCFAWYNVPQNIRETLWPDYPRLPEMGLDPNAPLTEFKNIKSHNGLPYITGNIYYSNWDHFITKEGNRKMFQETKWSANFEQTYMSYIYQQTIKGYINPGLLLLTPIEHNRFDHYDAKLRREN